MHEKDKNTDNNDQKKQITELAQKELVEAISTIRTQYTLFTQALSIIIIGNITVIGWAFSNQKSGTMLLGCIFPILSYLLYRTFYRLCLPVVYTAIRFESMLGTDKFDWLATSYLYKNIALLKELRKIAAIENQEERFKKLRDINKKPKTSGGKKIYLLSFLAFLIQFTLAIYLNKYLSWEFL